MEALNLLLLLILTIYEPYYYINYDLDSGVAIEVVGKVIGLTFANFFIALFTKPSHLFSQINSMAFAIHSSENMIN